MNYRLYTPPSVRSRLRSHVRYSFCSDRQEENMEEEYSYFKTIYFDPVFLSTLSFSSYHLLPSVLQFRIHPPFTNKETPSTSINSRGKGGIGQRQAAGSARFAPTQPIASSSAVSEYERRAGSKSGAKGNGEKEIVSLPRHPTVS